MIDRAWVCVGGGGGGGIAITRHGDISEVTITTSQNIQDS